jgi:serine/threonine protein kinase HipA of HipAB toxin-antitoxin module
LRETPAVQTRLEVTRTPPPLSSTESGWQQRSHAGDRTNSQKLMQPEVVQVEEVSDGETEEVAAVEDVDPTTEEVPASINDDDILEVDIEEPFITKVSNQKSSRVAALRRALHPKSRIRPVTLDKLTDSQKIDQDEANSSLLLLEDDDLELEDDFLSVYGDTVSTSTPKVSRKGGEKRGIEVVSIDEDEEDNTFTDLTVTKVVCLDTTLRAEQLDVVDCF